MKGVKKISYVFFCLLLFSKTIAQCPPNIDFENGDYTGWVLYKGGVTASNGTNSISLNQSTSDPIRNEMYNIGTAGGLDFYGQFPKNCPNGSGHSIKLGDAVGGALADGASYEFTIPLTSPQFTLTYYYAVVFQSPGHSPEEQPRMQVSVVVDGNPLTCASFEYVSGGGLPGFYPSPKNSTVICRNWSANSINLDGRAGSTVQIFFKTTDCTPGAHFGYAYIDVDAGCTSNFVGSSYCVGDTSIEINAPIGFQQYAWHYPASAQILGTQQVLTMAPPPPSGTQIVVDVTAYPGYGCNASFTVTLSNDLLVVANAGPDQSSCDTNAVQIGRAPKPGIKYKWTPSAGLSNPNIANPTAIVNSDVEYAVKAFSPGGGCIEIDTVKIYKPLLSNNISVSGNSSGCTGNGNTIFTVNNADSIQWYNNGAAIIGANQTTLSVAASGNYFAELFSFVGSMCIVRTAIKKLVIYQTPVAVASVDSAIQCFADNKITFKGAGSMSDTSLRYLYDFSDGNFANTANTTHSYNYPGLYKVIFKVTGPGGCSDDTTINILIKPGAKAIFSASDICINLKVPITNSSLTPGTTVVNYLWDFGDGQTSINRNPITSYTNAGEYKIRLQTSTPECPIPSEQIVKITVDAPEANTRYIDKAVIINFPEKLTARQIGNTALWKPSNNISNPQTYFPSFRGFVDQQYTIMLTTKTGCVTTDTILVKPYKKIGINVPTAFSPNGDGVNDILRPILWGIKKINYFNVYNRWGKLLYQTTVLENGWDGKVNGMRQNTQTIVWTISAEDVDGKMHFEKGTSIIMQ